MTDEPDAEDDRRAQPVTTRRLIEEEITPSSGSVASGTVDSRSLSGATLGEGRFEVLRRLGEGGTGVVYEAEDRVRRERVALKTLARLEPANIQRLKHEFRSLVEVVHPNLVGLHELFHEQGLWFFTMDLVQGADFISYVRGLEGTAPPGEASGAWIARLRAALRQLAAGVCAIHEVGKLHCDLKPSNVLVDAVGRLFVLDFGLVTDTRVRAGRAPQDRGLFGTPDYLAPERIDGLPATEASDWYAVGVVLFEALTGQLPYQDDRFLALRDRVVSPPPSPRGLAADLPEDLCALCEGLLAPDPRVRAGAEAISGVLGRRTARTTGSIYLDRDEEGPALVGREQELAELRQALERARQGVPMLVTLPGLSGMGKSALMAGFRSELSEDEATVVLSGRCHQWESVPYKTFDAVIDELSYFWRTLPPTEAAALLPRDAASLVRVFPVLSQVEAIARAPRREAVAVDPQELRRRAFGALRELLGRVGDRYTLVITIDDLQWGDRESARELVELLSPPDPPCMLVLCAFRQEELQPGGALRGLLDGLAEAHVEHLELPVGPLSEAAAAELAGKLADDNGGDVALGDIVREAEGSPFFLGELVRSWGRLGASGPLRLSTVVQHRLGELPATERELLDLVVVSPGPVQGDVLRQVSGLAAAFDGALRSLLSLGLLRTRGGRARDLVEPYHDRIREAVVESLDPAARRRHHQSFARVLGTRTDVDPESFAIHLEGAGHPARAARHYERAARRSLDALAFDHAAMLYRKAIELGDPREGVRAALLTRLAEALAYAGRGPESADAYREAAKHGPRELQSRLRLHAAEQLLYAGHNQEALTLLRDVLPPLGVPLPGSRLSLTARLIFDAVRLTRHAPSRVLPPAQQNERAANLAQICATLGDAVLYADFGLFAYFQQRHVLHGLASGEPGRVAEALTTRAMLTASPHPDRFDQVVGDLERARELADAVPDAEVRGRVTVNRAIVHSAAGHYVETEQLAREAERIFRSECQGVKWGLQLAVLWQSVALFYLGRFVDLDALCRAHLPHAHRRGDRMLTKLLSVWQAWAELAAGHPEAAEQVSPVPSLDESFTVLDGGVVTQRAPMLLYLGRPEEAWELYARALPLVRRSGILRARTRAFEIHWTRGLSAAHLLARGAGDRVGTVLQTDIRELESSGTADSRAMAAHLRGARAGANGDRREAARHYLEAAEGYEAHAMAAFEATLRLAAACADGGDDEAAAATLTALGVRQHADWLSLWCPGWKGV